MKRQALEAVIVKHCDRMEKCCHRLPGSFDQEDMHDLRVDYKKIRAFIRLLQLEKGSGGLHISPRLKAVYQAGGNVRDLQLFLAQLQTLPVAAGIPATIIQWQRQLFNYKEQTVQAIEAMRFKTWRQHLLAALPSGLHDATVKQFLHQKIATIHIVLLAADSDDDLHTVRKQLKDIIYVIRIFEKDWEVPFPITNWLPEKQLSEMASQLGDFNDRCLAISLLQSGYNGAANDKEKYTLRPLLLQWQKEKDQQREALLEQVKELKMEHSF